MNTDQERLKTPEENYEAAILQLAIYRMLQHERDVVKENASEKAEEETLLMASTPHILRLIEQQVKEVNRSNLKKYGVRLLKAVALVVLVLNMGLTIATAASATMRVKVINFLTEMNGSYVSIGFIENGLDAVVPENWEENYFPTFIPSSYVLQSSYSNKGISEVEYADTQGRCLLIRICDITTVNRLNTEDAYISHTTVHGGVTAIVLRQPYEEVDIIWAIGDRYFIVSSCDYETALAVAESVKLIQR